MDTTQLVVLCIAAVASAFIKNGVGVGAGIFLLPVLALVFPPKVALGIGTPIMLISDMLGVRNYWGEWGKTPILKHVLAASVVGVLLGGGLVHIIPMEPFRIGIGVFAMGFSACKLLAQLPQLQPWLNSRCKVATPDGFLPVYIYGALGGIASVLAHAGGLVWAILLTAKNIDKRQFVCILVVLMVLSNFMKIFLYMQLDILSWEMAKLTIICVPGILLASWFGNYMNKRIQPQLFKNIVMILIFIVGANLLH